MLIFDLREIGNRLFTHRKKAGLTQLELATAAGLSERTYAGIERGTVNATTETLLRICGALHITPDEILTAADTSISVRQSELLARLDACPPKEKETALRLLDIYLKSVVPE